MIFRICARDKHEKGDPNVTETKQESTQLHNYHSSTNISCEQWGVIHGLWLTFQEILEYELTKLTA